MTTSTTPTLEWIRGQHESVPVDQWGQDHWSTFAYIETRTVDYKGFIGHDQMRCSVALHGSLYDLKNPYGRSPDGARYKTRLKHERLPDGTWSAASLPSHDDYSCLDDCLAAGLLEVNMPTPAGNTWRDATGRYITRQMVGPGLIPVPGRITPRDRARLMGAAQWRLTPLGQAVAAQLRTWKANGGAFHDFEPDMVTARRAANLETR
uniref:hypothetical protein n=1 Tax=Nonomuraea sp. CA-251285 TaxID=3240002 RepID=UPI003F493824